MDTVLNVLVLVGGLAAIATLLSIGGAFAKRIGTARRAAPELQERIAELERRLAETEDGLTEHVSGMNDRLLELDDRLEFTERLLQQVRERERLPRGEDASVPRQDS